GGSGVAMGLPDNFARKGLLKKTPPPSHIKAPQGRAAIIAGSCSEATRGQIRAAEAAGLPAFKIDPFALARGQRGAADVLSWASQQPANTPILVYSSDEPEKVRAAQAELGREAAGAMIERELAAVAQGLADTGFSRLIVAGGETSGVVVGALGIKALEI